MAESKPKPAPKDAPKAGDAGDAIQQALAQNALLADAVYALTLGLGPALDSGGDDGKTLHQILKTKVNALNPGRFTFDPPNQDF